MVIITALFGNVSASAVFRTCNELSSDCFDIVIRDTLTRSVILLAKEGSQVSISISSGKKLSLKSSEGWLSAEILTSEGLTHLVITAKENWGMEGRSSKITITSEGNFTEVIEVFQKNKHEE